MRAKLRSGDYRVTDDDETIVIHLPSMDLRVPAKAFHELAVLIVEVEPVGRPSAFRHSTSLAVSVLTRLRAKTIASATRAATYGVLIAQVLASRCGRLTVCEGPPQSTGPVLGLKLRLRTPET